MTNTYRNIRTGRGLDLPDDWLQIKTIDMHTGGEPLRVILEGFPELEGNSVLEYRRYCRDHYDHLRTALMHEPRGHLDMYGCLLCPPNDDGADFGILFLHNEGYSTMCGHAIIAIATLAVKLNWIDVSEGMNTLKIDAPCGRITAFVTVRETEVTSVSFHGVPSYVVGLDSSMTVEGLGPVTYDLAYGGAYYAYVDLAKNDFTFDLDNASYQDLRTWGMAIKNAVMQADSRITHPFEEDLGFLYGTILIGPSQHAHLHSKNVCIFADGEIDRCPTGSGVSGRMAIHRARNEVETGDEMAIESITGSVFKGSVIKDLTYGPFDAVIPKVEGTAHITGMHTFVIDPSDPMKDGFILR